MDLKISGKLALVTGASGGIGQSVVLQLLKEGSRVIATSTSMHKLEKMKTTFVNDNIDCKDLYLYECDLSDQAKITDFTNKVLSDFAEGVDFLILNAGIVEDSLFMRMKEDQWEKVLKVNLSSAYYLTKPFITPMIKKRGGRIVVIGSVVGSSGNAGQVNYSASKAGLIGFVKSLSYEVAKRNITVNMISPGFIKTNMTESLSDEQKAAILTKIPAGYMGKSEDIASSVCFLCSAAANYITAHNLHINGGMYTV